MFIIMKTLNFKLSLSVGSVLFALLFSSSSMASDSINGNACMAANLNQAFELKWDHARIENPASNPNSRFVTCAVSTGPEFVDFDPLQAAFAQAGQVVAYFSADADPSAEVSCIFRQMSSTGTTTVATTSKAVTISSEDDFPVVKSATFVKEDGFNIGFGGTLTVTCKLDPGTGINEIMVNKIVPTEDPE